MARLDLCPDCGVELHVCRMCRHYAPGKPDDCDEDDAIEVRNKTAANFCDYFLPEPKTYDGAELSAENAARNKLADLFGEAGVASAVESPSATDDAMTAAERLFRKD